MTWDRASRHCSSCLDGAPPGLSSLRSFRGSPRATGCSPVHLRGHGQSEQGGEDFTSGTLLDDVLAVLKASGAQRVIPVALSHAGWFALELPRALGQRIAGLVLLDWIVLEPPPPFLDALKGLQSAAWQQSRDALFGMWLQGVDSPEAIRFVREDMGSFSGDMWKRAALGYFQCLCSGGLSASSPLRAGASMPTVHLYSQPEAPPGVLDGAAVLRLGSPWFQVFKLDARSHFPTLEVPGEVVPHIERFLSGIPDVGRAAALLL